jgi:hypothetical protein
LNEPLEQPVPSREVIAQDSLGRVTRFSEPEGVFEVLEWGEHGEPRVWALVTPSDVFLEAEAARAQEVQEALDAAAAAARDARKAELLELLSELGPELRAIVAAPDVRGEAPA